MYSISYIYHAGVRPEAEREEVFGTSDFRRIGRIA